MNRRLLALLAALGMGGASVAATTASAEVPVPRAVQAVQWSTAAECRLALKQLGPPDACHYVDGRFIGEAQVAAYEKSWTHRALGLQRGLDANAPLIDELFAHTHNSFNASAYDVPADPEHPGYYPTLTNQDPNQVYSLTDQLRMDIRAIELDLHWFPSPYGSAETGGNWVTLCHGQTDGVGGVNVQIGCTYDRPAQDGFAEVAAWMKAHPKEFVLLYLENQLQDSPQAHIIVGDLLKQYFGAMIVPTPKGKPCAPMPYETSRAALMAQGHRLLIVGNCSVGAGTGWGSYVHERGPKWDEGGDPSEYSAQDCAKDSRNNLARKIFRRQYEDQTFLTALVGTDPSAPRSEPISKDDAALMARCGINLIGFDQLRPEDGRLDGLVWSWAQDEPRAHGCTYQGSDGRWRTDNCGIARPAACASGSNWRITQPVSWAGASAACRRLGASWSFSAPVNGLRNALLATAKGRSTEVWVNSRA